MYDAAPVVSSGPRGAVDASPRFPMAATSHPIPVAAPSPTVVWQQYRRTGDRRLRDRLVFTLAPLVRHAGATTPAEAQVGLSVLLVAIEDYSPAQDGPIESFAWTQIRSALASA